MFEAMKLLKSTERRISKDKNGDKVPQIEITEVVFVHFDSDNNQYQHDSIYCLHLQGLF